MSRVCRYSYFAVIKNQCVRFECYTDIAAEFNITKGVVAGKFYRSKNNTINIGNIKIHRERI